MLDGPEALSPSRSAARSAPQTSPSRGASLPPRGASPQSEITSAKRADYALDPKLVSTSPRERDRKAVLAQDNGSLQERERKLQKLLGEWEAENMALRRELTSTRELLGQRGGQHKDILAQNAALRQEAEQAKAGAKEDLEEMQRSWRLKQADWASATALSDTRIRELEAEKEQAVREADRERRQNEVLSKKNADLQKEVGDLRSEATGTRDDAHKTLRQKQSEWSSTRGDLETQLAEAEAARDQALRELEYHRQKGLPLQDIEADNESLRKQLKAHEDLADIKEKQLADLSSVNTELRWQLDLMDAKAKAELDSAQRDLARKTASHAAEKGELEKDLSDKVQQRDNLQKEVERLRASDREQKITNDVLKKDLTKSQELLSIQVEQNKSLTTLADDLRKQVAKAEAKAVEDAQRLSQDTKRKQAGLSAEKAELDAQLRESKVALDEAMQERERVKRSHANAIKDKEAEVASLQKELEANRDLAKVKNTQHDGIASENTELRREVERLTKKAAADLEELQRSWRNKQADWHAEKAEMETKLRESTSAKDQALSDAERWKRREAALRREREEESNSLRKELTSQQDFAHAREEQQRALANENEELRAEVERLGAKAKGDLDEAMRHWRVQQADLGRERADLEAQLRQAEAARDIALRDLERARQGDADREAENATLRRELRAKQDFDGATDKQVMDIVAENRILHRKVAQLEAAAEDGKPRVAPMRRADELELECRLRAVERERDEYLRALEAERASAGRGAAAEEALRSLEDERDQALRELRDIRCQGDASAAAERDAAFRSAERDFDRKMRGLQKEHERVMRARTKEHEMALQALEADRDEAIREAREMRKRGHALDTAASGPTRREEELRRLLEDERRQVIATSAAMNSIADENKQLSRQVAERDRQIQALRSGSQRAPGRDELDRLAQENARLIAKLHDERAEASRREVEMLRNNAASLLQFDREADGTNRGNFGGPDVELAY